MTIYERIKDLAKGKISINKLEKELGISRGSLCKIDKNKPTSEKLQKIADFFDVSTDYLLTGQDITSTFVFSDKNVAFLVEIQKRTNDARFVETIQKYMNLSANDKKSIDDMVDFFIKKRSGLIHSFDLRDKIFVKLQFFLYLIFF